ncbi:hypothetical protein AB4Z22_28120, partial [Paenibacillus sp. TAF58]
MQPLEPNRAPRALSRPLRSSADSSRLKSRSLSASSIHTSADSPSVISRTSNSRSLSTNSMHASAEPAAAI